MIRVTLCIVALQLLSASQDALSETIHADSIIVNEHDEIYRHKRNAENEESDFLYNFGNNFKEYFNPSDDVLIGIDTPVIDIHIDPENSNRLSINVLPNVWKDLGVVSNDRSGNSRQRFARHVQSKYPNMAGTAIKFNRTPPAPNVANRFYSGYTQTPKSMSSSPKSNGNKMPATSRFRELLKGISSNPELIFSTSNTTTPKFADKPSSPKPKIVKPPHPHPVVKGNSTIPHSPAVPNTHVNPNLSKVQQTAQIPNSHPPKMTNFAALIRDWNKNMQKSPNKPNLGIQDISTVPQKTQEKSNIQKSDKQNNYTAYPEILVAVDYAMYSAFNNNTTEILKYMLSFWTAADLRYRSMQNPKVRLHIAGIVLLTDAGWGGRHIYNLRHIYNEQRRFERNFVFLKKNANIPKYDIAVLITYVSIEKYIKHKKKLDIAFGAVSTHGDPCSQEHAVAGVVDTGNFRGVHTAVHELAHHFGAAHDEVKEKDDQHQQPICRKPTLLYIMGVPKSVDSESTVRMHFSPCSLASMEAFFRSPNAQCLYNKPTMRQRSITKTLPNLSLNEQCHRLFGTKSYSKVTGQRACEMLKCSAPGVEYGSYTLFTPAHEGSICDTGKVCLNGKCVGRPSEMN